MAELHERSSRTSSSQATSWRAGSQSYAIAQFSRFFAQSLITQLDSGRKANRTDCHPAQWIGLTGNLAEPYSFAQFRLQWVNAWRRIPARFAESSMAKDGNT